MEENNGLGLEYSVGFDTETDGLDATQRIIDLNKKWEKFMLDNPIHVKFDTSAYTQQNNSGGGNGDNEKAAKKSADEKEIDRLIAAQIRKQAELNMNQTEEADALREVVANLKAENPLLKANADVMASTVTTIERIKAELKEQLILRSKLTDEERKSSENSD